jgi:hypothetical protein
MHAQTPLETEYNKGIVNFDNICFRLSLKTFHTLQIEHSLDLAV